MVTEAHQFDVNRSLCATTPVYRVSVTSGSTTVRLSVNVRVVDARVEDGATLNLIMHTPYPVEILFKISSESSRPGKVTLNDEVISGGAKFFGYVVNGYEVAETVRSNAKVLGDGVLLTERPETMPVTFELEGPATVVVAFDVGWQRGDVINVVASNSFSMIGKCLYVMNGDSGENLLINVSAYVKGSLTPQTFALTPGRDILLTCIGFDIYTGAALMYYMPQVSAIDFFELEQRVRNLES